MPSSAESPPSSDAKACPLNCALDKCSSITNPNTHQTHIQRGEISDMAFASTEKSLVRKLDYTLMPTVFTLYLFNYLDRNNIAQAKLDSFEADLGLKGNDYNIAVSILVVGYVLMQLPSNMILTRVRPSLYIPLWVCLWSCVSASTAAVQSFRGLVIVRFVLGITEAPFFPGVFYLLSCWYTKKELALRYAVLYSGLVLATAISGLVAAGIFSGLDGVAGLAGWRWLFILEGAASLILGLSAFCLLPDFPGRNTGSARWLLTKEERHLSSVRMSLDSVSSDETNTSVWYGLKLAVSDYKVWIFALILCSNQSAYGFNYFYPAIVQGFNLGSRTITLVCTAPPYIIGAVVSYFIAWSSDKQNERCYHICAPMSVAVVGFIISASVLNLAGRYCASFLYICGVFGANAAVYSWAAFTVSDTYEKKAAATAIINIAGQFGSIWSPYFFDPTDEPRYARAMILLMVFSVFEISLCFLMRYVLCKENKRILARSQGRQDVPPTLYML